MCSSFARKFGHLGDGFFVFLASTRRTIISRKLAGSLSVVLGEFALGVKGFFGGALVSTINTVAHGSHYCHNG
jgi:hypothetical protein